MRLGNENYAATASQLWTYVSESCSSKSLLFAFSLVTATSLKTAEFTAWLKEFVDY
jgi:hypothetical protein